jgi:hypothetical protein
VLACSKVQPLDTGLTEQATFTFAIARHAAADLAQSFAVSGREAGATERSGAAQRTRLIDGLSALGLVRNTEMADGVRAEIDALRQLYEGHMVGLGHLLLMEVPPWMPAPDAVDDWQTTADDLTAPPIAELEFRDGRLRAARRGAARPTATGARVEQDTTPPVSGS